jgi:Ca2+-transporting ATPase
VFGILIQLIIIEVPFFADIFEVFPLTLNDWMFVIGLSIVPVILNEAVKAVKRAISK